LTITRLSASICTYQSPPEELLRLLNSLCAAAERLRERVYSEFRIDVSLIDNAELPHLDIRELGLDLSRLKAAGVSVTLRQGWGNVGYGAAHNSVLSKLTSDYHLILNTDVELAPDSLEYAVNYLSTAPDTVLVSPAATDFMGNKQHLCKAYPSLLQFWLRGYAPPFMRRQFAKYMAAYERRDLDSMPSLPPLVKQRGQLGRTSSAPVQNLANEAQQTAADVAIVSGCCMLCKTTELQKEGGFDPRFFLYFEDFDLSLRLGKHGAVVYLPTMRVRHGGGNAAKKGPEHRRYFIRSAVSFFNKHGWKLF
jgi:GT2 family glycosyltransferase